MKNYFKLEVRFLFGRCWGSVAQPAIPNLWKSFLPKICMVLTNALCPGVAATAPWSLQGNQQHDGLSVAGRTKDRSQWDSGRYRRSWNLQVLLTPGVCGGSHSWVVLTFPHPPVLLWVRSFTLPAVVQLFHSTNGVSWEAPTYREQTFTSGSWPPLPECHGAGNSLQILPMGTVPLPHPPTPLPVI